MKLVRLQPYIGARPAINAGAPVSLFPSRLHVNVNL